MEGLIIIWQNFETILANLYDFGQIWSFYKAK